MFCWDQTSEFPTRISYLELVLLAPEIGPLLLPEVVGFDDVSGVHGVTEVVLQHLQDGLDCAPAGVPPHVYHHAVAEFPHVLAEILELLNILTELHSCFVFISGSFKSLPTSVISSLIQLNVQAGSRQYLIPEEREERIKETQQCLALNFKKIHSPNFLD